MKVSELKLILDNIPENWDVILDRSGGTSPLDQVNRIKYVPSSPWSGRIERLDGDDGKGSVLLSPVNRDGTNPD